jgi:pimeloyl-ACP methyl ester carboxylesterase
MIGGSDIKYVVAIVLLATPFATFGQAPIQVDPNVYDAYAGAYELSPEKLVFVRRADAMDQERRHVVAESRLYYVEESGSIRNLFPSSESTFFAGPAMTTPDPADVQVSFVRNDTGEVTGLTWRGRGLPERFAPRSARYREEAVSFQNGSARLSASLLVPAGKGPHPAVVLGHGGGVRHRNEVYNIVADFFAARGIAALLYDKRGVGQSTGDYTGDVGILAEDLLAGVAFVRARNDINPKQVGLWVISGGTEAALVAAARSQTLAFLILVSAPGVPLTEWYSMMVEAGTRGAGSSEEEIKEAVAFVKRQVTFARTGEGREEFEAAVEEARSQRWFSRTWNWQELQGDSDPASSLRQITCPVLVIYGELDIAIGPVAPNKAAIEKGLSEGGNRDYTIQVFPKGSHQLWLREGRDPIKTYVPGYFDTMTEWIGKRTSVAK